MLQTEVFEANEYIAACYTGVCDISGEVFLDSNGNGVYDRGIDSRKYYNEVRTAVFHHRAGFRDAGEERIRRGLVRKCDTCMEL